MVKHKVGNLISGPGRAQAAYL